MCRIMAIAGIKPHIAKAKLWDFLMHAKPFMIENNRDGLGFAAMGKAGLWGERWWDVNEAWSNASRKPFTQKDNNVKAKFNGALEAEIKYNSFGIINPKDTTAVIYHSRAATSPKSLENVHPFVRGNTALIHNGVIRNDDRLKKLYSTCDSEVILNQYVDLDVANNVDKIQEMTPTIQGSYGCAVLTITQDKKRYLDIFRETSLVYAMLVEELEAVVYCTDPSIIQNTCDKLGWHYGFTFKLKEELLLRLDCESGSPVLTREFKPFTWQGYSYQNNSTTNSKTGSESTSNAGESQKDSSEAKTKTMEHGCEDGTRWELESTTEKKSLTVVPSCLTQEEMEKMRAAQ